MKLKNHITFILFCFLMASSAFNMGAQSEKPDSLSLEDMYKDLTVTRGPVPRAPKDMAKWFGDDPTAGMPSLHATDFYIKNVGNQIDAPIDVYIFEDGSQFYSIGYKYFFYIFPDSINNAYTGEKYPDYDFRLLKDDKEKRIPALYLPASRKLFAVNKQDDRTYKLENWDTPSSSTLGFAKNSYLSETTDKYQMGGVISNGYPYYNYRPYYDDWMYKPYNIIAPRDLIYNGHRYTHKTIATADKEAHHRKFWWGSEFEYPYDCWVSADDDIRYHYFGYGYHGKIKNAWQKVVTGNNVSEVPIGPNEYITNIENLGKYCVAHFNNGGYVKYSLNDGLKWNEFEGELPRGENLVAKVIIGGYRNLPTEVLEFTSGIHKGHFIVSKIFSEDKDETFDVMAHPATIYDADFKSVDYIGAEKMFNIEYEKKREQEIAQEKEQKRQKQARDKSISDKVYNDYCVRYGKKYVDALLNEKIIVGMPEALVKGALHCSRSSSSTYSQSYYVYITSPHISTTKKCITDQEPTGTMFTLSYYVKFVKGKVASVSFIK